MREEYLAKDYNLKKIAYSIYNRINVENPPVFMCVGSDKFVADSLAPIIAETLKKKYNTQAYIYGGLDYNINAQNLTLCYNYIEAMHPASDIILVDATVGENVGAVVVTDGAIAGMGQVLPNRRLGDISILGVVGKAGRDFRLNKVRLNLVVEMSEIMSQAIAMAVFAKRKFSKDKNKAI